MYVSEEGAVVALYKVIFLGLAVAGPEEEAKLLKGLQKKFNLNPERAESLVQRVPIVVKKGVSEEEMERYVRAFEEIGGRVRVEAEPIPETLQVKEVPPTEPGPFAGKMMTCPQCGFEQPETDECIKCGVIVSEYSEPKEQPRETETRTREASASDGKELPPWESGEGFITAFFSTTYGVLFSPSSLFRKVANGSGYWSPLLYGLIAGIIGVGVSFLWFYLILARFLPIEKFLPLHSSYYLLSFLLPLPFQYALNLLVESAVTHLCLIIVAGNKNRFQATFRAVAYSFGAYLFGIVPLIGFFIGGLYQVVLVIVGVREGHGISTGRAILAVLLPLIVLIGLGIIAAIFIPLFFGSVGFLDGVKI